MLKVPVTPTSEAFLIPTKKSKKLTLTSDALMVNLTSNTDSSTKSNTPEKTVNSLFRATTVTSSNLMTCLAKQRLI